MDAAPADDVMVALLRWAGLAVGGWVLVSTGLYTLASLTRIPSLIRGIRWLTPLHGVVDRALAVGMAASIMVGTVGTAAHAHPQRPANATAPPPGGGARPVAAVVIGGARAPSGQVTREVRPGETLWGIAENRVGKAMGRPPGAVRSADVAPYWRSVVRENRTRTVAAGDTVALPPVFGADVADRSATEQAGGGDPADVIAEETYDVHPGDSLWRISERHLGDPLRWPQIFELNEGRVSGGHRMVDPDLIYPGEELVMPGDASSVNAGPPPPPAVAEPASDPPPVTSAPGQPGEPTTTTPTTTTTAPASPSTTVAPPPTAGTTQGVGASSVPGPTAAGSPAPTATGGGARHVEIGDEGARIAEALALGVPLLAAGGIVYKLNRGRRRQVSRCRPGRDIPRPDPALEPLERKLRAIAADQADEWVNAALRALTAALRNAPPEVAPEVTCVRAGELGIEVLLAKPAPFAPEGFELDDAGYVWRLSGTIDLAELRRRGGDSAAISPALVSLGASPEGPVLVDLEAAGTLSVGGDPDRVRAFLAGAALELATARWANGLDMRLLDTTSTLGALDNVTIVEDASTLVDDLDQLAVSVGEALGVRRSPLEARIDPSSDEDWLPTVVVAPPGCDPEVVERLSRVARPGSGVALLAAGPLAGATWRLTVIGDGSAVLEPVGMAVRAAGIGESVEVTQAQLDEEQIAGAASLLAVAGEEDDVAEATAPDISRNGHHPPEAAPKRYDVWVGVLGPVEVTGWAEPIGSRRKLAEIVAYLATHSERPVPGERLRCACWSNDISYGTFKQAVSRTRRHLGTDAEGHRHLPEGRGGAYQLGPDVGCDWVRFEGLTRAAERAAPHEAMKLYRDALSLVRGEPFADVTTGTFTWAWSELLVHTIQCKVAKAADALGRLALDAADPDTALWAAHQGLLVSPTQLSLFEVEMQAAAQLGDLDGINRGFRAATRAAQELDPLGEVPDETARLYRQLLAERRSDSSRDQGTRQLSLRS